MFDPIFEYNHNQPEQYDPFKALAKRLCEYDIMYAFFTPPKCYIKNCVKTCPSCFICTEKKFQIVKEKLENQEEFIEEFYDFAGVSSWFEPVKKAYSFNSLKEFYDFYKEKNLVGAEQLKRKYSVFDLETIKLLKQHENTVLYLRKEIELKKIAKLPSNFFYVLKDKNHKTLIKSKYMSSFARYVGPENIKNNNLLQECIKEPNKERNYYIELEYSNPMEKN